MHKNLALLLAITLAVASLATGAAASVSAQEDPAQTLLDEMTAEERIGQLILVTMQGGAVQDDSAIAHLIRDHHVSGVVLGAGRDNLAPSPDTVAELRDLAEALQMIEYDSSQPVDGDGVLAAGEVATSYVPLFIAINDEEADTPITQLIDGMSDMPPPLAVGASWDPTIAEDVGAALGEELVAMGINLYLGPSLDVLEGAPLATANDLGTRAFGGDPFWVSLMGESYVRGLHTGSQGRLAVIGKHFPGLGSSDRPLDEEVATVRKSIDQLLQIELPPFFRVTDGIPGDQDSVVDGLLVTHIRYQGFQGNIRATTRPISLDPEAYGQLLELSPISEWRAAGGITVSDSLGSRAVRRFRDPSEETFQVQLVARDALVAGNDLLYLANIRSPNDPDELTTIQTVLAFFTQKYVEDPVFAQRVDEAALRILRLKMRQFGTPFSLTRVLPPSSDLGAVGSHSDLAFSAFRSAASLISPRQDELADRLGGVPELGERIVFITDVRPIKRCDACPTDAALAIDALERRINSLYGPGASGQVGTWNLWSFSMADLSNYLGNPPPEVQPFPLTAAEEVDEPIRTADWLIFSIMDVDSPRYGADALQRLLDERPDLVQEKRVVVFGFDVPYVLDATDLSKVDAYFSLYGASAPAVDLAARLLFQEVTGPSAPPVSVPGIGYELIEALKPDPSQIISLAIEAFVPEGTPTPDLETGFVQGGLVRIQAGPVLDSNGQLVPDDTPVEFEIFQQAENIRQTIQAFSENGLAEITFRLDRLGLFVIQARSDPALRSDVLQLDVQEGVPAFPTVFAPTPLPTNAVIPTETSELQTATPAGEVGEEADGDSPGGSELGIGDLILGLLGVAMVSGGSYWYVGQRWPRISPRLRYALVASVGGLAGYNYLALSLPGSEGIMAALGMAAGWLLAMVGGVIALGFYVSVQWGGRQLSRQAADGGDSEE